MKSIKHIKNLKSIQNYWYNFNVSFILIFSSGHVILIYLILLINIRFVWIWWSLFQFFFLCHNCSSQTCWLFTIIWGLFRLIFILFRFFFSFIFSFIFLVYFLILCGLYYFWRFIDLFFLNLFSVTVFLLMNRRFHFFLIRLIIYDWGLNYLFSFGCDSHEWEHWLGRCRLWLLQISSSCGRCSFYNCCSFLNCCSWNWGL